MFNSEELKMLETFMVIEENVEDSLLKMVSKHAGSRWMLVDYSDRFKERYGVHVYSKGRRCFNPLRTCSTLAEALKCMSDAEYDY